MGQNKLWALLGGRPLLAWSLDALAHCNAVQELVVVVAPGSEDAVRDLLGDIGAHGTVVRGGARRQDSSRAGVEAASTDWVAIHDAARPFVSCGLVCRGLDAARVTGAAVAALPVADTIKRVAAGHVVETPDRAGLWAAQTPQVFNRALLLDALERFPNTVTDDAQVLEAAGVAVRVFEGAYANIKVTTPLDLRVAAAILASVDSAENQQLGG
jgi:2-C-methyl-D-erythritol 4-phosphate cytidylyltransferase